MSILHLLEGKRAFLKLTCVSAVRAAMKLGTCAGREAAAILLLKALNTKICKHKVLRVNAKAMIAFNCNCNSSFEMHNAQADRLTPGDWWTCTYERILRCHVVHSTSVGLLFKCGFSI